MPRQSFDIVAEYWETAQLDDTAAPGAFAPMNTSFPGDRIILSMLMVSDDSVDRFVTLSRSNDNSATIATIKVPAGAGYGAVDPVDVLSIITNSARRQLWLDGAGQIFWALVSALSSGKVLNAYWEGGAF